MPKRQETLVLENFNTFGELLHYARERLHITQRELAARINYHHSYISYLEKNQRLPDETMLMGRIVPALGLENEPEIVARMLELVSRKENKPVSAKAVKPVSNVSEEKVSSLPTSLTSMLGRERESARLIQMSTDPNIRLISIVGPPGVGKTRLALHVAEELQRTFSDGVWFVNLMPIHDEELIIPAITAAINISDLRSTLKQKHLLLVMDNFEQVVDGASQLLPLLRESPGIKILATSREALRVNGEHEFHLSPLSVQDKSLDSPAIQLFVERVHAVHPEFQLDEKNASIAAEICRHLDGLPLAIELAAARIRTMSLTTMLQQMNHRLEWLTRGGRDLPAWRQTLWGTIQWSYNLLSGPERELFNRLSVFSGGWTLEAAEYICSDEVLCAQSDVHELLNALADKSLIVAHPEMARYSILETLCEFAHTQLSENQGLEHIQQLHCEYFLKFARTAHPHLQRDANQADWFNIVHNDYDNLRTALAWATAFPDRAAIAMEFGYILNSFWLSRSHIAEARHWLNIILAMDSTPTTLRSDLLQFASTYASAQGDYKQAHFFQKEAQETSKALGDEESLYTSMDSMAILTGRQGDYAQAASLLEQTLLYWRKTGNIARLTPTLNNLSIATRRLGRLEDARKFLTESISITRAAKNHGSLAHALLGLAEVNMQLGNYEAAIPLQHESIVIRSQIGSRQGMAFSFSSLAISLHKLGHSFTATQLESASEKIMCEIGMATPVNNLAEKETFHAELKSQLGEIRFEEAWERGQRLTLNEVMELALQGTKKQEP